MAKITGIHAGDSALAVRVQQGKKRDAVLFWIPRSIISYMRKTPVGQITEIVCEVPDWFVNKPENKKIDFE